MSGQLGPPQGKPHLLIHNCGEFTEHVLIMGPQFFLVLQLVLLDEALIHVQSLPTCVCKLPSVTAISKLTSSHRKRPLSQAADVPSHPERGWPGSFPGNSRLPFSKSPRKNVPTKRRLPENFLQKLYLVVRVFLCIGFFKKSSRVGHWSSIYLSGEETWLRMVPLPP